jgi:hypothetical protein
MAIRIVTKAKDFSNIDAANIFPSVFSRNMKKNKLNPVLESSNNKLDLARFLIKIKEKQKLEARIETISNFINSFELVISPPQVYFIKKSISKSVRDTIKM